jgi:iron complex transport system substrate-binding protein
VRAIELLVALLLAGPAAAAPRVVSMNPCLDAILLRVAEPAQVTAISHWSHDLAATSLPLAEAKRFPAHGGTAEEVISARPDLVLLTPYTPLATRAALARLGIKTLAVGVPATIDESLAQVREVAAAVGQPARGARLVAAIERDLAAARRAGPPRPALMRLASGLVPGPGSLSEALMAHTGLESVAPAYGLKAAGVLGMEALALKPPPLLITDRPEALHPVAAKLPMALAGFERRLLNCGGPSLAPAAARFAAIRDSLP